MLSTEEFAALAERVSQEWGNRHLDEVLARRAEVDDQLAHIAGLAKRNADHYDQIDELTAEGQFLDGVIATQTRKAKAARNRQEYGSLAVRASNLESGDGGGVGAPAFIRRVRSGDDTESPAQVIQRMGNPWAGEGDDSAAGLIARAHAALEGLSGRLTDGGAEKLAGLLAERSPGPGLAEVRTEEHVRRSAALILAATSPFYESAFRHVLRDPLAFRSGLGALRLSDDERAAFAAVEIARAALFEDTSTTGGGWMLPLVLDDTILLTNSGSANPWRRVCKTVSTTAKTWNGVTSAGVSAHWYAEGAITSDDTPVLAQLQVTPHMEEAWAFASYEQIGDSNLGDQIPKLMDDAFSRLESAAFATGAGDGSNAPWGAITRATVDGSTGLVSVANAVSVFSLLNNIPVRFRDPGSGARPYWACNIAILNALRGVTAFTAATASIVDDSTSPPRMFGIPVVESSDMDGVNTTGGHKNLLLFDANSFLIVERLGTRLLYEPMVKGTGGILPAREGGWLAYRRVGSDAVAATALRVHNNV